ncbi:glutathione S-transferase [Luminiphilus syltensis]|nr:glutathione S-transferase [Luminiphilus syltensis]
MPILYSFRRCPYAIRARLALAYAGIPCELREVVLKNKPRAMLDASPKGTVPVVVLADERVIDESLDVMHWALAHADPDNWQTTPTVSDAQTLLDRNDGDFKHWLDRYKYADRHPENTAQWYREQTFSYLEALDQALLSNHWLHGPSMGFCDAAIFPFIRQFAMVDRSWFDECRFIALRRWLDRWLDHPLYQRVMAKYPPWTPGDTPRCVDWALQDD